tara:strand:+ start:4426 stop:5805 length:1380 start_codon:yes stop_codon:yes gene_type:complete
MATPLEILKAKKIENQQRMGSILTGGSGSAGSQIGRGLVGLAGALSGAFTDPDVKAYEDYQAQQDQFNQTQQAQGDGGAFTPAPYKPDYNPQADMSGMSPQLRQGVQSQNLIKNSSGASAEDTRKMANQLAAVNDPRAEIYFNRASELDSIETKKNELNVKNMAETGKRLSVSNLMIDPTNRELRQKAVVAGVSPSELNDISKLSLSAQSTAGKQATDLGFTYGTPEYQAKVKELLSVSNVGTTIINKIGGAPDSFLDALGKKTAEAFAVQGEDARTASIAMKGLSESAKLLNSGKVISGITGSFNLGLSKVLAEAGLIGTDSIEATESFFANQGRQVAQVIKAFGAGTGLSDADREYAQKIAGGEIKLDESSLRRLIQLGAKYSEQGINDYNTRVEDITRSNPEFASAIPKIEYEKVPSTSLLKDLPTSPNEIATNPETGVKIYSVGGNWVDKYGNKI